jgi:hypothetical protein
MTDEESKQKILQWQDRLHETFTIRIMVASRWPYRLDFLAAAIKRSISAVVRYSRGAN